MNQPAPAPPANLNPNSPEFQAYHQAFTAWVNDKDKATLDLIPRIILKDTEGRQATTQDRPRKPSNRQKPAWGLHDRDRVTVAPPLCKDCKIAPRLPRGSRCLACKDKDEDRQEVLKHTKRRVTPEVITITASKK